ncbi:uncharacterized protein LOC106666783 isoform X2 [Cimex lectularius]|uniref:Uncharacterized protein n=1 Tax=Cimex lectularius TaxID=79782 RepID=A0A8I6RQG8_CIMLE|nr:uncharacterized protein LOC106666783 isoform X2 [Cimex lectularius]
MSHQPQVDCDTCSASFTKLTLALLLVVPVGAAVYFWRKKCILEHQLHNLEDYHLLEKIGLNRSRKKSRINQELHQKSLIGSGIKGESKSFYQTSMGFSSRLNAEYQKNIVHKEKEACIPTNLKKESKLQKPTEIGHIKDPYSKKNLASTVNWLSKTLQATNMSLLELMEAVMQVTNDVKVIHGDNLYISRRLTVLENQCPKSQRKL